MDVATGLGDELRLTAEILAAMLFGAAPGPALPPGSSDLPA